MPFAPYFVATLMAGVLGGIVPSDPDDVCVDTNGSQPSVDPNCEAERARERAEAAYVLVCTYLEACVLEPAFALAFDSVCEATGEQCGWREETCFDEAFSCDPLGKAGGVPPNLDYAPLRRWLPLP